MRNLLDTRWARAGAATLVLAAALISGCRTSRGPDPESLASVTVTGDPLTIAHAVSDVFQEAGFMPVPLERNKDFRLEFDRPGGLGDTLVYGDWADTRVWYRAKVRLKSLEGDLYLVSCNGYRVLDHGDSHFEDEHKLSKLKRGAYQRLLDKVGARLKGHPG